ncbi:unnamed protein product [Diatraea saccharalis]|uniref:Gloverin n=1 Tax=Diatraea saccharalis TaxID=40085 RepID=A0A9N9WF65_9NEOP|nr:unnamed protein product [Diatraea saccharalis]
MKITLFFGMALITYACAQVYRPPRFSQPRSRIGKRDVTWDKKVGDGKIFGTLGSDDSGLFGKGGYKQDIFNDDRGKLQGQAYGSRVLGPNGDVSSFGGRLDFTDKNSQASLDVNKPIGGRPSVTGTGSGVWNFDKNTRLSAGGTITQELGRGKPDLGLKAQFQHDF